jgi:hypothetical protein
MSRVTRSIDARFGRMQRSLLPAIGAALALLFVCALEYTRWRIDRDNAIEPPHRLGAPVLRVSAEGARIFVLSGRWQHSLTPRRSLSTPRKRTDLHVDLWVFDAATLNLVWRRRVHSERDGAMWQKALLGIDGETVWVYAGGLRAFAASDGAPLADAVAIEQRNPALRGQLVGEARYYGFDRNGVFLTDAGAHNWRIDAHSFVARAAETTPAAARAEAVPPAWVGTESSTFQSRGVDIGANWLGVLSESDAQRLAHAPVVPGSKPGDRPGVMADYLAEMNVPANLDPLRLDRYRLWRAKITRVSAGPKDWPKELPDNWGTRASYSDYRALPDAPEFLAGGLLDEGQGDNPLWMRDPDSVLVLHRDRLGDDSELQLARVAGPAGRVLWDRPLGIGVLHAVMRDGPHLVLVGESAMDRKAARVGVVDADERLVALALDGGAIRSYSLTVDGRESLVRDGN